MARTGRRTSVVAGLAATAGLCLIPSTRLYCHSFSSAATRSGRPTGDSSRGAGGIASRLDVRLRHRSTLVRSTVEDLEMSADGGQPLFGINGHQTPPPISLDPDAVLSGTTTAAVPAQSVADPPGSVGGVHDSSGCDSARAADFDAAAAAQVGGALPAPEEKSGPHLLSESNKPKRRKGREPEVVEGDGLANTPKMVALVWSSLALNFAYLLQAFFAEASSSPLLEALGTAGAGAFVGYLMADLFSGLLHWSLDNYGGRNTPVFGTIIDSFQGHHASPWTITHRPFENNVHKVTYAALPLLALLRLADPGLFGVALGVAFLFGSLMSNEFHKYSHMVDPPPLAQACQRLGLSISRKQHGRHHSGTFDEKYCLVSGICNDPMDNFGIFRFLERAVYETNGAEPIAWKLDPSLKEVALSTGWLPFAAASRVEMDGVARSADQEDTSKVDRASSSRSP